MHNTQNNWLKSPLGDYVLANESKIYDEKVADIFGYHALQIGMVQADFLQQSRISKRLRVDINAGDVLCESEYLPFSEASIDLVCLPHVLEFSSNPHQTLREVERILVPEGYLILTGFNPMSTWGLRARLSKNKAYPWCGRHFSAGRIKDWLALLGLEYVNGGNLAYIMPINDEKWITRQSLISNFSEKWCPLVGGVYYIVAKKRVVNMTLLKPGWKNSLGKSGMVVTQQKSKPIKNKKSLN